MNNKLTGQIILRDVEEAHHAGPGRKMMMVVGVIAVPESLNLKGECKYTIGQRSGSSGGGMESLFKMVDPDFKMPEPYFKEIDLKLLPETEEDVSDETIGQGLGGIILSHNRWRV
jgi:hypothetical protein